MTPDVENAIRSGARLVKDPTDFAAAYPHGGTSLGLVAQAVTEIESRDKLHEAPELGGEYANLTYGGLRVAVSFRVRDSDPDSLAVMFAASSLFSGSGTDKWVRYPATYAAGGLGSARSVRLLIAPLDPALPALYFYSFLPTLSRPFGVQYADDVYTEWSLTGVCRRDASGRMFEWAPLAHLTVGA